MRSLTKLFAFLLAFLLILPSLGCKKVEGVEDTILKAYVGMKVIYVREKDKITFPDGMRGADIQIELVRPHRVFNPTTEEVYENYFVAFIDTPADGISYNSNPDPSKALKQVAMVSDAKLLEENESGVVGAHCARITGQGITIELTGYDAGRYKVMTEIAPISCSNPKANQLMWWLVEK